MSTFLKYTVARSFHVSHLVFSDTLDMYVDTYVPIVGESKIVICLVITIHSNL